MLNWGMRIKLKCPTCGAGPENLLYLEDAIITRNVHGQEGKVVHLPADYTTESLSLAPH
jgi:hypothetical protein